MVISLEDGALFVQPTGQPKLPIFADSETRFSPRVNDAAVSFTKDDSGAVDGLILSQNGVNRPLRKVRQGYLRGCSLTIPGPALAPSRIRLGPIIGALLLNKQAVGASFVL